MKLLRIDKKDGGRYLKKYELVYENKSGREKKYEIVSRKELKGPEDIGRRASGVSIVAVMGDRLLLLREFRMSINKAIFNLCAGMTEEGETLEQCIARAQQMWGVQVYLEPGEACALNAGYLASRVLDVLQNGTTQLAILDASAACHMPDVLEMPYRPEIIGSGKPGEKPYTYRLGGNTCLAGDIIGDYSFDSPLREGDRLVFCDMAIYSMVKNNTFNGMKLPSILLRRLDGTVEIVRSFGYEDFKGRL